MAKIEDINTYWMDHLGETKSRYVIKHGDKEYVRWAYNAVDAIERLAYQYGWGDLSDIMYDADTRGKLCCECWVSWGSMYSGRFLSATIAEIK